MRRAVNTFLQRRLTAVTLASSVRVAARFQSGHPPPGVPPEMRAPPGADIGRNPASLLRGAPPPPPPPSSAGAAEEDFQPPQKPTEAPKYIKLHTNEKGVTSLQLSRGPVNSLNLEFFQEMNQWMLWLGSNEETKAVIISSAIPTVFSAGLDLAELYNPQPERFTQFWQSFQELWLIMNSFPKPIIGAVTGNSPAGGCIIAMGCDYRVMARGPKGNEQAQRLYRIGLNECKLGIVTPAWAMPAYAYLLGSRQAERMLQLGETPTADDALKLGLIDQVVEDEEKAMEVAHQYADRFLAVPQQSRWMARDMMRREYLQMLASEEDRSYDTEFVTQLISSPEVQKSLGNYLDRLKGKARK